MPDDPVAALMRTWPVVQRRERIADRACILATRVGMEVLRQLGIDSEPFPCACMVFNDQAAQLYNAGIPISEWPDHAWSIGIGYGTDDPRPGWDGHLLLHVGDQLVDLAARQYHRPGLIEVPGPVRFPYSPKLQIVRRPGLILLIDPLRVKDYRDGNDWRVNWKPLVPKVLEALDRQDTDASVS